MKIVLFFSVDVQALTARTMKILFTLQGKVLDRLKLQTSFKYSVKKLRWTRDLSDWQEET